MNTLTVTGSQKFMGKEIPVILGGFGVDKKCISDKTIADIHEQPVTEIRRRIADNIKRFKENIDFMDMKQRMGESHTLDFLLNLGYAKQSITQAERIYILSERGYAKLIKIMDTDLAWEIHDNLMDEYFQMREGRQSLDNLSPQLQFLINVELEQKRQAEKLVQLDNKVDSIKDVVALNPNGWRKDTSSLITKMAQNLGGYEHIKELREESYRYLDKRMGVSLSTRLTNKRRRMADEGICKSRRDKLNQLDVVADDKKLIEGYVAIVKEMAIRYGVA